MTTFVIDIQSVAEAFFGACNSGSAETVRALVNHQDVDVNMQPHQVSLTAILLFLFRTVVLTYFADFSDWAYWADGRC